MKKIEAIIRRTKFDDVKDALLAADIEWFSYYEVRGVGKMREARIYRGVAYDTSSIERMLLSIVVRDKNVEKTVQASMVFSAVMTFVLFKVVDKLVGIRVDKRVEEEGLDIYEHGESAYDL